MECSLKKILSVGILGAFACTSHVLAISAGSVFQSSDFNAIKTSIESTKATTLFEDSLAATLQFSNGNGIGFHDSGTLFIPNTLTTKTLSSPLLHLTPFATAETLPKNVSEGSVVFVEGKGLMIQTTNGWIDAIPKATITGFLDNIGSEQGVFSAFITTDDTTPTLQGTLSSELFSGEKIQIFENTTLLGNANITEKTWTFTTPVQSEGLHTYHIKILRNNGKIVEQPELFSLMVFIPSTAGSAGKLNSSTLIGNLSLAQVQSFLQNNSKIPSNFIAKYGVKSYKLEYYTKNQYGNTVLASGLIALPQKTNMAQSPVMSFQHGTIFQNAQSPSNNASSYYGALASLGYIVVAADYVGYGSSHGQSHPYLQSEPSANAVIDFLKASREFIMKEKLLSNEQLFLTGYSEGGYVTMASHKKLETLQSKIFKPLANVSGAGPYNLSLTLDLLIDRLDVDSFTKYLLSSKTLTKLYAQDLADTIMEELSEDGDVIFDNQFLVDYFKDDQAKILANNVNKWKATIPIVLTHGRNDETVPFENTPDALTNMQTMGSSQVSISECVETPSNHLNCVKPYLQNVVSVFGSIAKDL